MEIIVSTDLPEHTANAITEAEAIAQQEAEALAKANAVPQVITMRQARLALLEAGLLTTVDNAITTGTDETLKIEWEYATEVRRDWQSLINMATSLSLTSIDLDDLFKLGGTK